MDNADPLTSWGVLYLGDQELGPLTTFMPWTTADDKSMVTLVYRGDILLPEEAPVDGYRAVLTEAPLSRFGTVGSPLAIAA